jgi:hypothetical protein
MGLQTLEFSDCLVDSPYFRDKLHQHEKELERTSKAIKHLIAECKELLNAARSKCKQYKTSYFSLLISRMAEFMSFPDPAHVNKSISINVIMKCV